MSASKMEIVEKWEPIPSYGGYQISNLGRVKSYKYGKEKLLNIYIGDYGYPILTIRSDDKKSKTFAVHILAARAFVENPHNKAQVNHINGIRNDGRASNLEWVTPKENTNHSYEFVRKQQKYIYPLIKKEGIVVSLDGEIWRDVRGHEKIYKVSNFGRVKALSRNALRSDKTILLKEKLLSPQTYRGGYVKYHLYDRDKTKRTLSQHRLIAIAFIENPLNKPDINHKNGIRNDNRIENLEWCSKSENTTHSYKVLKRKSNGGIKGVCCKKVAQYDLLGNLIQCFYSIEEAGRILGVNSGGICSVCNKIEEAYENSDLHVGNHAGRFLFMRYDNEPMSKIIPYKKRENLRRSKPIFAFDINGGFVGEYPSSAHASRALGLSDYCVLRVLVKKTQKQHKGYTFSFKNKSDEGSR